MKPIDRIRKTPLRRYDLPAKSEGNLHHFRRFRKRHFDFPVVFGEGKALRVLETVACIVLILVICNASAPVTEVPSVQQRFEDWARVQNEKTIQTLPGATPEPNSELDQIVNFNAETQLEEIQKEIAEQTKEEQVRAMASTDGTDGTGSSDLKHYEPGELSYRTDRMSVSIEQKQKDGLTYYVCDIQLSDPSQLRTAFAGDDFKSGIYEAVSDIAGRYNPVLAINADFCRYHRNGVIIRNGELLRKQNIQRHHLLVVDANGDMSAITDRSGKQGVVADQLMRANTWQTFEFGPVLVENGQATELPSKFYVNCHDGYYEPRTAVGQIGPLHYMVIVVDGRRDGYSTGCSIPKLQQLFLDEGVQFAFNLDGGGSTTLYFLGRVINMPSGGKQRSVSDIMMFMANPVH
ncbi:MAG: phosphodiester glycosidase family protein [Clostridia bacterium]|nr:phosphodiester glycosidase family protein [Clostridia bacterium]